MPLVKCTKCRTIWEIVPVEYDQALIAEVKPEEAFCPYCGTKSLVWV